jgi:hypothetical protein
LIDKSQVYVSIFSLSTIFSFDNRIKWVKISEC